MISMKNILINFKFQLSRAKVNVIVAILRNMLLAVRCFQLWTDVDITSLSTPMGVDFVVIGFDMEVQPLVTHNAA